MQRCYVLPHVQTVLRWSACFFASAQAPLFVCNLNKDESSRRTAASGHSHCGTQQESDRNMQPNASKDCRMWSCSQSQSALWTIGLLWGLGMLLGVVSPGWATWEPEAMISPQVFSQGGAHEILTAHTPESARFLRYHYITSAYDSVTLDYQIGEFWVRTRQGQWKPICWAIPHVLGEPSFGWPYRVITDTAQGDAQSLLPYLQSEPFDRELLDSIRFYRVFRIGVDCRVSMDPIGADTLDLPPGDGSPLADHWRNTFWVAPEGTISDQREFVVQLRDAESDSVLVTVDSVGILPNAERRLVPRYGTDPTPYNHVRVLPPLGSGRAYIQIVPRRYGGYLDDGFCLQAPIQAKFNYSCMFEPQPNGDWVRYDSATSVALVRQIDSLYFDRLIAYCDSIVASPEPCLPPMPLRFSTLPERAFEADSFFARYYDTTVVVADGRRIVEMVQRGCQQQVSSQGSIAQPASVSTQRSRTAISAYYDRLRRVLVCTVMRGSKEFDEPFSISAWNIRGQRVLHHVYPSRGEQPEQIAIPMEMLAAGIYAFRCRVGSSISTFVVSVQP
ncbi:MAG: hypothetical protein KatS3mg039_1347 [Candidatus Kapaibacterium sp.]|nr:MAG: hypothetical protein KatS3mg023_3978 [Armatimonadota bacterium]GIV54829.1 MAG: hypothetical protein KatS3mg039_1347 [Candidatus Kapabacteria bacterium]